MPIPLPPAFVDEGVSDVARIIQTALTPIFLLTGVGTLLGLFNTRLARVSDQLQQTDEMLRGDAGGAGDTGDADEAQGRQLARHWRRLHRRVLVLDASVALGAIAGAATCGSVVILFLGSLREASIANWLIALFGVALGCTICSLMAFLADSLLAWHGLRRDGPVPRPAGAKRG